MHRSSPTWSGRSGGFENGFRLEPAVALENPRERVVLHFRTGTNDAPSWSEGLQPR
jgi:hypothetical protein